MRAMMAMAFACWAVAAAAGQEARDVAAFSISETNVLGDACFRAFGEDCPRVSLAALVERIDRGDVKLVVVESYFELPLGEKAILLTAMGRHIDRGGRQLLEYTKLDAWPWLQELVCVRTTGDVTWVHGRDICSVDPSHPVWPYPVSFPMFGGEDFWEDNGDFLDPSANGYVLATWEIPGGHPAMTLTRAGRVLVNGFDFDAFDGFANALVVEQLLWLLSCPADIDSDGELTIFDFLAFQNLFVAGDP